MSEQYEFDETAVIVEYGRKLDEAQAVHRREYARRNPPPRPPGFRFLTRRVTAFVGFPWIAVPILIIALAGSALSALRTFPVFQEIAGLTVSEGVAATEGFLAMLAVDLAVVSFRFVMVYLDYKDRPGEADVTGWIKIGLGVAVATQAIAQLYATRDVSDFLSGLEVLAVGIAIMAALSAMVLAFITGEIIAVLWVQSKAAKRDVFAVYEAERRDWHDRFGKSWDRSRDRYGLARLSPSPSPGTDRDSTGTRKRPYGDGGPSPSERLVIDYIQANPVALDMSVRDLAAKVGVSKSVAGRGRQHILSLNNGHQHEHSLPDEE